MIEYVSKVEIRSVLMLKKNKNRPKRSMHSGPSIFGAKIQTLENFFSMLMLMILAWFWVDFWNYFLRIMWVIYQCVSLFWTVLPFLSLVSQFPFDECIKKARVFLGPERFQTRDRRKLTYYTFKTQAAALPCSRSRLTLLQDLHFTAASRRFLPDSQPLSSKTCLQLQTFFALDFGDKIIFHFTPTLDFQKLEFRLLHSKSHTQSPKSRFWQIFFWICLICVKFNPT